MNYANTWHRFTSNFKMNIANHAKRIMNFSDHSLGLPVIIIIFPEPLRRLKKLVRSTRFASVKLSINNVESESIKMISGSKSFLQVVKPSKKVFLVLSLQE